MAAQKEVLKYLEQIGLTGLEAEIYLYLVQHSPASGYKVAKGIGRSFTNVYKALETLRGKGAILLQDGKSKLSRAVPIEEFLEQVEARARQQRLKAAAAINALPKSGGDSRIYHLRQVDQVYERARRMLDECEEHALIEVFPEPCEVLRESIEACAARGVKVAVRTYAGEKLDGTIAIESPYGEENLETWKSQWLALYVDGRQFLVGDVLPGGEGVHEAIWSANPHLAYAFFSHANQDLTLYAFLPELERATTADEARAAFARVQDEFPPALYPGHRDLMARLAAAETDDPTESE